MKLSELRRRHEGEDIFVVGMGTSLRGFDFERLRGSTCIALNDAIKFVPQPCYHLYTDHIYKRYREFAYHAETVVVCRGHSYADQHREHPRRKIAMFTANDKPKRCREGELYTFATVAATGVHLAQRMSARRIYLLGFDGYRLKDRRYHDGRYQSNKKVYTVIRVDDDERYQEKHHLRWGTAMDMMRSYFIGKGLYGDKHPGSGVFNLSKHSMFETWEKVDVEAVL